VIQPQEVTSLVDLHIISVFWPNVTHLFSDGVTSKAIVAAKMAKKVKYFNMI
jgi:hypothetical protein